MRQFWKQLRLTANPSVYISSKPVMSYIKVFQQPRLPHQWFISQLVILPRAEVQPEGFCKPHNHSRHHGCSQPAHTSFSGACPSLAPLPTSLPQQTGQLGPLSSPCPRLPPHASSAPQVPHLQLHPRSITGLKTPPICHLVITASNPAWGESAQVGTSIPPPLSGSLVLSPP